MGHGTRAELEAAGRLARVGAPGAALRLLLEGPAYADGYRRGSAAYRATWGRPALPDAPDATMDVRQAAYRRGYLDAVRDEQDHAFDPMHEEA